MLCPLLRLPYSTKALAQACDSVGFYEPEIIQGHDQDRSYTVPSLEGKKQGGQHSRRPAILKNSLSHSSYGNLLLLYSPGRILN